MSTAQAVAPVPSPFRQAGDRMLEAAPVVVLVFDLYWFVRSFTVITGMWSTFLRMRRDMSVDWLAMCREPVPEGLPDPLSFHHLSIIPTYTEPYNVLERTVRAIVEASY